MDGTIICVHSIITLNINKKGAKYLVACPVDNQRKHASIRSVKNNESRTYLTSAKKRTPYLISEVPMNPTVSNLSLLPKLWSIHIAMKLVAFARSRIVTSLNPAPMSLLQATDA